MYTEYTAHENTKEQQRHIALTSMTYFFSGPKDLVSEMSYMLVQEITANQ